MISVISNCIHDFFLLFSSFFTNFFGSSRLAIRYFLPGLAIGLGIFLIFIIIKVIRSIVWGS